MWCFLKILKYLATNTFFLEIQLDLFSCQQHWKLTGGNWNASSSPCRAAVALLGECDVKSDPGGFPGILTVSLLEKIEITQCYWGKIIVKYYDPWELLSSFILWLSGVRVLKVFRAFSHMSGLWFKWYAQTESWDFQGTLLTLNTTCCQNQMCWKQNNKTTSFL